jgi:hypothetical protein
MAIVALIIGCTGLCVALLESALRPTETDLRWLIRDELRVIDRERAESQRRSVEADLQMMKERAK